MASNVTRVHATCRDANRMECNRNSCQIMGFLKLRLWGSWSSREDQDSSPCNATHPAATHDRSEVGNAVPMTIMSAMRYAKCSRQIMPRIVWTCPGSWCVMRNAMYVVSIILLKRAKCDCIHIIKYYIQFYK
jgi:hypothetical protein